MNRIIIGNVDNEDMLHAGRLSRQTLIGTSAVANRLAWLASPGDILVLPYNIPNKLLKLIGEYKGCDLTGVRVVIPHGLDAPRPLNAAELLLPSTIDAIRAHMRESRGEWELIAYFNTGGVEQLASELGVRMGPGTEFLRQGGANIFNQKSIFRKLAAGIGVPFARGEVVSSVRDLCSAVKALLPYTGSVILKQDRNAGGDGNIVVTNSTLKAFSGAAIVHEVTTSANDIDGLCERLAPNLFGDTSEEVIVEAYHRTQAVLYSEFLATPGKAAAYRNHGIMRMQPLWAGFEIPGLIPHGALAQFISSSSRFTQIASDMGYSGLINLDAVMDDKGDIIFTECNGRAGGCTHLHELANELVGSNYLNERFILSQNKIKGKKIEEVMNLLTQHNINFSKITGKGCLVLNFDEDFEQEYEIMTIGESHAEAIEFEIRFLQLLSR